MGFNIPTIPQLATGGIVTAPTILEAGEGGEPEAIVPLSQLAKMLDDWTRKPKGPGPQGFGQGGGIGPVPVERQNPQGGSGEGFKFEFHYHGNASPERAKEAAQIGFAEFKRLYNQLKAEERRKNLSAPTR